MNIELIVVGKIKEKYYRQGIDEYLKRLSRYAKVSIIEVADEATGDNMSEIEQAQVLDREAERILSHLKRDRKVWVLAIEGDLLSSEDMAKQINKDAVYGQSKFTFIIGGSLGLSQSIKDRADVLVSFGRMTLPHQLMRLVLVEQIYRFFRIINNEPYHK